jgi:hypothetical protein
MTIPTIRDCCAAQVNDVAYLLECIRDGSSDPITLQGIADRANTARDLLRAEPAGEGPILRWTDNAPPSEDCRYDHCTAETPFGRFLISWKSWKQFDSPTVDETPWGDWYGAFDSVDEAKAACQEEMDKRLARWGRPATLPAPEVGEVGEVGEGPSLADVDELCAEFGFHYDDTQGEPLEILQEMVAAAITRWRAPAAQPAAQPVDVANLMRLAEGVDPFAPSPAAQAVLDAFWKQPGDRSAIAAALLAVADQVVPEPPDCGPASHDYNKGAEDRQRLVRFRLLAIAAELKTQP